MRNKRGIQKYSGNNIARPYVNEQTFTKMYNISTALKYGTIFPELNLLDSLMYNKELYKAPKGGKR